jgi:cell division protein FtsW
MFKKLIRKFKFDLVRMDLLCAIIFLIVIGAITFFSASIGILNRNEIKFYQIIESQLMAYFIGFIFLGIGYIISPKFIKINSIYLYLLSLILCFSVFVTNFGLNYGGSTRWINFLGFSLQPGELLKVSILFITSSFLSYKFVSRRDQLKDALFYGTILILPSLVLFFQKDLGTLLVVYAIAIAAIFVSEINFKLLLPFFLLIIFSAAAYTYQNDYVMKRLNDYVSTTKIEQGISYQNKQALISIGNGELFGRGIGQSVQKFFYLPEPAGDSIFAVYLEEYGFVGGIIVMFLYLYIMIRFFILSYLTKDKFTKYFLTGASMLVLAQTFLNIGSMLNVIPISGDTLPLFSQGGTALICNMFVLGFVLQLTKK